MTLKRCPKCKTDNPEIYDNCLNCGTPLPDIPRPQGARKYLVPLLVVALIAIVTFIVVIPALHYSATGGTIVSTAIKSVTQSPTPSGTYAVKQPARLGDLELTVLGGHSGTNQFNGQRFYTVSVSIQNFNNNDTYTLSATDFILSDTAGNYYDPMGIQSKTSYDAMPGQTGTVDLVYIIPQGEDKFQLLYTFPETVVPAGGSRTEVAFLL